MIIAIIIPFDTIGGAETFALTLLKRQIVRKEISKIIFITFQTSKYHTKYSCPIKSEKLKHINLKYFGKYINHIYVFICLFNFLITNKVNVVHSHLISAIYLSIFPLFFRKVKFVHTIHNQAKHDLGSYKYSPHFFLRYIYYSQES